jgi:aryl-phospho-beta-D-glucosidase BglC (GH1 family)
MSGHRVRPTGVWVDRLELRQLFAAASFSEAEPNNSMATAVPIDMRKSNSSQTTATASGRADRDYFRVKVGKNSRIKLLVQNLSGAGVKLRVTDAFSNTLATTSKQASVYLEGGRSYFIKVQSKSSASAKYRIDINSYTSEVSKARLDKLRKGVNLPEWFWNITGDVRSTMRSYITADDVALIKSLGFGHVRLPVDMQYFFNDADHSTLDTTYLQELKSAILMFHAAGIAVIACPFGEHQSWLTAGGDAYDAGLAFTAAFAKYLGRFNPELTFLQTANEPPGGGSNWQPIQASIVSTIRTAAPKTTIITATPLYYGSGMDTFGTTGAINELSTYRDTNIVYGLHFYEPFVFTHQGAGWAIPGMEFISGLRFPADVGQTASISDAFRERYTGTSFEPVIDLVKYYGLDGWNSAKLKGRLDQAKSWASRNGVPIILDEFGVYGTNVDDASRYNYLSSVRTIAESSGFGWTLWDYNSEFGIVEQTSNGRTIRYDVLAALNLKGP